MTRRTAFVVLLAALCAACGDDDGSTDASPTLTVETSSTPITTAVAPDPTAVVPTEPAPATNSSPLPEDAGTPFLVSGEMGRVWEVRIDGYLAGEDTMSTPRGSRPCAWIVGRMQLVEGAGLTALINDVEIEAEVPGEVIGYEPLVACTADVEGFEATYGVLGEMLPGAGRDLTLAFTFSGDAVPPVITVRLHNGASDVRIEVGRLSEPPEPWSFPRGEILDNPLEPPDLATTWTDGAGVPWEIRTSGIQLVDTEFGACAVVYAWAVLPEGDGMRPPSVRLLADGWAGAIGVGERMPFECVPDEADPFWTTPLLERQPSGAVVQMTHTFVVDDAAVLQAILLPDGVNGANATWRWVEPVLLDSPPPAPSGSTT